MNLSLTFLDWIVFSIVMGGSLAFVLYMAYIKKAGQNSTNFFLGGRSITWPVISASLLPQTSGQSIWLDYRRLLSPYAFRRFGGTDNRNNPGICPFNPVPDYMKNRIYTIPACKFYKGMDN
jgi:solute:Na+ symporter, SSS family